MHNFVTDRITWTMGVQLYHISNANLGDRNTGDQRGAALCWDFTLYTSILLTERETAWRPQEPVG